MTSSGKHGMRWSRVVGGPTECAETAFQHRKFEYGRAEMQFRRNYVRSIKTLPMAQPSATCFSASAVS
jgi:hypothetical protein